MLDLPTLGSSTREALTPRQAAAAAGFATTTTSGTRPLLKPPKDLNDLERQEFVALVLGAPPNHFLPSDLPLLACYSKAIVAERSLILSSTWRLPRHSASQYRRLYSPAP